ncbi:dTDP-3-amino-3,4,6-trideoxy-alpha-D-glucopyranose [compost metagenome]
MALYEAGYKVTGIDLSGILLKEARNNDPEGKITWIQSDMRDLPLEEKFDAVVNLFTSFGYFDKDEEHVKVLKEISRVLKPGGRFIIDFLNPEYTISHLVPHSERVDDGQRITENRVVEDGYVKKKITIIDDNISGSIEASIQQPRNYLERIRMYTKEQFADMLHQSGLKLEKVHGGYDEEEYDEAHSPRMIMVGTTE